jgi:RNA polymerase sigma-70 factor (ECF subfamily)
MLAKKTDQELVRGLVRGDQAFFEELVARYSPKVFSLAARLTKNAEDAEEVLQDVFVTVHKKIAGFEGKSSFSSWLYRVTMNSALMKLRKRRTDRLVSVEEDTPEINHAVMHASSEQEDLDSITLRGQLNQALELAIKRLPEEYRPVFILRDVDGLSSHEVSKILKLSIPAVKSRLHRSRLMLRRRLVRFYQEYQGGRAGRVDQLGEELPTAVGS